MRAPLLETLLARLDGLEDVRVVTDPGGARRSSWRSHRACLEALPGAATHLLVVQDDALPCRDFAARTLAAVDAHPDRIVCLFTPGFPRLLQQTALARRKREPSFDLTVTTFVPLVATIYPTTIARDIPVYADKRRMPTSRADDAVVAAYARAHRVPIVCTVPSLAEHQDGPSLMGLPRGGAHRKACWFEGDVASVTPSRYSPV